MNKSDAHSERWYNVGAMWLVVGGPLLVVIASFISLYLAITRPDPVYSGESARPAKGKIDLQMQPAIAARNAAAQEATQKGQPAPADD